MEKIAANTYRIVENGVVKIRLYSTIILTFSKEGIRVNTGGYATKLTKARIKEFSPFQLVSERGALVLILENGDKIPFEDNMLIGD